MLVPPGCCYPNQRAANPGPCRALFRGQTGIEVKIPLRMIRISDFYPHAELDEVVREIVRGFVYRSAVSGDPGHRIWADRGANFLPSAVRLMVLDL